MRNEFDVIIIGAGPAGLGCAQELKDSNLSVLLIEKNKIIGPKVCAGGLSFLSPEFDFPEQKMRSFNKVTVRFLDKKYEVNLAYPLRIIDRYDFGQHLLNKIKDSSNITILKGTIAKEIKRNKVVTNKGEFHYKYLVGADGSYSIVRKFLGLKSRIVICLAYKTPRITDEVIIDFNPQLLQSGGGYLWVFPHRNYTHCGIGFKPKYFSAKKGKEIFENFLRENDFTFINKDFETAPINLSYQGHNFGKIFLAGDAAGLVLNGTGEGILPALISGEEIAKKILNPDYKLPNLKKILKFKKRQERIEKLFELFPWRPEYFFKVLVNFCRTKWFQKRFTQPI